MLTRLISAPRILCLWSSLLIGILMPVAAAQQSAPAAPSVSPEAPAAQPQYVHLKDYSKPRAAFPHVLQPYTPQQLPQPNLGNSARIDSLMSDGKIYLSSEDGDVFVVKAGPKYELLAKNPVGEVMMATPAISDGLLIVRTVSHIYAFGEK